MYTRLFDTGLLISLPYPAMAINLDPEATVNIPCPSCGEKSELTVADLGLSPRIRCTACGVLFAVDGKKILKRVREAQEAIELQRRRLGH